MFQLFSYSVIQLFSYSVIQLFSYSKRTLNNNTYFNVCCSLIGYFIQNLTHKFALFLSQIFYSKAQTCVLPQSSLQPLCFKAELALSKISHLEKHHLQSSNRDKSDSKNISQSNKSAIDFKSNYPCTHNYSQRLLSNNRGFSLVEVLVAAAIGLVFIGIGYEVVRVSQQSMLTSQVIAAEQDLRAAIASALGGNTSNPEQYCNENLHPSKISNLTKLTVLTVPLLEEGKPFNKNDALAIADITFTEIKAATSTDPAVKKLSVFYTRRGEASKSKFECLIDYEEDGNSPLKTCKLRSGCSYSDAP